MLDVLSQSAEQLLQRATLDGFVPLTGGQLQCVACWNRSKKQRPLRPMLHPDGMFNRYRCIVCDAQEKFRTRS